MGREGRLPSRSIERAPALTRAGCPELAGPVPRGRQEVGAVRREGHAHDLLTVAAQRQQAVARGHVPELRG
eukprot:7039704-Alexandrium_andersonii.AAC.1